MAPQTLQFRQKQSEQELEQPRQALPQTPPQSSDQRAAPEAKPRLAVAAPPDKVANAFCPHCFTMIEVGAERCPVCGRDLQSWHAESYPARLMRALQHPLSDVRMRAIIALGLRHETAAEPALLQCAKDHPDDVIEGLEIAKSLRLIASRTGSDASLLALAGLHHAKAVIAAARKAASGLAANRTAAPSSTEGIP